MPALAFDGRFRSPAWTRADALSLLFALIQVQYDFKKAEQYLLDIYFTGKPLIDLEVTRLDSTFDSFT